MADGLLGRDRPVFDFEQRGDKLIPRERRIQLPIIDPVLSSEIVLEDILDAEEIELPSREWSDTVTYRMSNQMVALCFNCGAKLVGENRGVFWDGCFFCGRCCKAAGLEEE